MVSVLVSQCAKVGKINYPTCPHGTLFCFFIEFISVGNKNDFIVAIAQSPQLGKFLILTQIFESIFFFFFNFMFVYSKCLAFLCLRKKSGYGKYLSKQSEQCILQYLLLDRFSERKLRKEQTYRQVCIIRQ